MTNKPSMKPESVSAEAKPVVAAPPANDTNKKAEETPAHGEDKADPKTEPRTEPTKS